MPSAGAVFNLGGGRCNSVSILEGLRSGRRPHREAMRYKYVEKPRAGRPHLLYLRSGTVKRELPGWNITNRSTIFLPRSVNTWEARLAT